MLDRRVAPFVPMDVVLRLKLLDISAFRLVQILDVAIDRVISIKRLLLLVNMVANAQIDIA